MLVSLINIELTSTDFQVIINLTFNNQVHSYVAKVEENGGIMGVSLDRELFQLITDISNNSKASQTLIRAVLTFYHRQNVNFPIVLGEIKTPKIDSPETDP